jgi:hypothetical protein
MSGESLRLTIPEVASSIERQHGKRPPIWKLRRVVDSLEDLDVYRAGNYRLVAEPDVSKIITELRRQRWLPSEEAAPCAR